MGEVVPRIQDWATLMPTAYSHLAGQDVDTSSEIWRHECECRWLLDKKPTRTEKHMHLYGVPDRAQLMTYDAQNQQVLRANHASLWHIKAPIMKYRGLEAADRMLADAKRIYDATKK